MSDETELLTLAEAAALLGLAPGTLRGQVRKGSLHAEKRGHDYLVMRQEVERYRRENLGRIGRPSSRPTGLSGLLSMLGQDPDGLELRVDEPRSKPSRASLPMETLKPEFGRGADLRVTGRCAKEQSARLDRHQADAMS